MESRYTWKNQLLNGLRNFGVTGGIILVLIYLVLISGEAAKEELEEMFVEEKATITRIDEPVAFGYEDGAKVWEIRSEVVDTEKESESSELYRIYELILFKGGEENLLISGDHGDWDKPREELTLTGNVEVESSDGTTFLDTEVLIWEERTKTLSCPEFVDFWVEDNHIVANSLYSDDDLVTIDFIGDVEMFVIGLEGENFVTREGDFPIEDLDDTEGGDGMNILARYVHYDKSEKICLCYPYIPLVIQRKYKIDAEGNLLPPPPPSMFDPSVLLLDPDYIEAIQISIAEMDLSPEMEAFLAGELTEFPRAEAYEPPVTSSIPRTGIPGSPVPPPGPGPDPVDLSAGGTDVFEGGMFRRFGEHLESELNTDGIPGVVGEAIDLSAGGMGDIIPGMPGQFNPTGIDFTGEGLTSPVGLEDGDILLVESQEPEVSGPMGLSPDIILSLPELPRGDSENVLTVPDYSYITNWEISSDLDSELFETDMNFDPYAELRDGLVFCYRNNKKIWSEELHIFLGDHQIEALRRVDARFYDIGEEDPDESRVSQALSETPTQLIANYLVQNWETDITEGYGRVLSIQPEKDTEADNFVYYERTKLTQAWGDVIVHQFSGEWWETSGAIEDVEDERAREDVRKPTVITTDAILSYSKKVTWGFGNVVFRQEEQVITGDRAQYEEENEMLVMAGSVDYVHVDGDQLQAALLTMDLKLEEYIAEGAAIARNKIPEEYEDNLEELRDDEDRKPEDDARTRLLENRTASGLGDWSEAIEHPPPIPPIEFLPDAEREELERSQQVSDEEFDENLGADVGSGGDLFSLSDGIDVPEPVDEVEVSVVGSEDPGLFMGHGFTGEDFGYGAYELSSGDTEPVTPFDPDELIVIEDEGEDETEDNAEDEGSGEPEEEQQGDEPDPGNRDG